MTPRDNDEGDGKQKDPSDDARRRWLFRRGGANKGNRARSRTSNRQGNEFDIEHDVKEPQKGAIVERKLRGSGNAADLNGNGSVAAGKKHGLEILHMLVGRNRRSPVRQIRGDLTAGEEIAITEEKAPQIRSRSGIERFAYAHFSKRLPNFPSYREAYEQSGISLIYESYLSTAFLVSVILAIPTFLLSLFLESSLLRIGVVLEILGSIVLGGVAFAVSLQVWLIYPLQKRNSFRAKLDNQLAYSFGVLGVLSAAGLNIERLIEKLATSESNPVLAGLARRFLRDVKVFGLDTESALKEIAQHSPSRTFSKMLESIAIAFRTTGSIHDLVMFESSRLFEEKKEKLTKIVGNLSLMAELYITLIVVGPIIFIVMMAIFGLLPAGGLPDPILVINVIAFVGVPVLSVMFILMIDSLITKA